MFVSVSCKLKLVCWCLFFLCRFEFIVEFVKSMKKTDKNKDVFKNELEIARQMIELLPAKINSISSYGSRFAASA